jgi:hypothetical protein
VDGRRFFAIALFRWQHRDFWMRLRLLLYSFLLSLFCGVPGVLAGELSGSAEVRYGSYQAEVDGVSVADSSHFVQQYSTMYNTQGVFHRGRGGQYNLGLGGEWSSINSRVDGEDIDIATGKILYRGDFTFAPGGLPFRLHAYSRDQHKTQLITDTVGATSGFFRPDIVTDLINGQRITTGITLTMGIKNGHYAGRYRDILAKYPRLLMDYQETYVRNLESNLPQHYRQRNLAFVSLNKKDNWFHYRFTDFKDYEAPGGENDYIERGFMLGTVDHTLRRHWVNMTNWIKVSVDGALTMTEQHRSEEPPKERYDLNFFATARRPQWQANSFSTYKRLKEGSQLDKVLETPFFLNGAISPDTSYRFRFIGVQDQDLNMGDGVRSDENVAYASTRLEVFRRGRYVFEPEFEAEVKGGDEGRGSAQRITLELHTNNRYAPRHDVLVSYDLTHLGGTATDGADVAYWEHRGIADYATDLNPRVRTGLREVLLYGEGSVDRDVAQYILPRGDMGTVGSQVSSRQRGSVLRSTTTGFIEFRPATLPLQNRLAIIYDIQEREGSAEDRLSISHSLRYDRRNFRVRMLNELTLGHDTQEVEVPTGELSLTPLLESADTSYSHSSSLRYSPSRLYEATFDANYNYRGGDLGTTSKWTVKQKYLYNFFRVNGLVRKIATLDEELTYDRYTGTDDVPLTATYLTVSGSYYPTRRATLGARVRYGIFSPGERQTLTYYLNAGLNYEKLTVSADYAYGTNLDATSEDRVEHRWELAVKKIF